MEKLGLNKLREMFLSFYEEKGHYRRKSFPLIPQNDKSLLIINSGMAPLKPYFSGEETPPASRMCTCQKCIRTADIENVGHTARHGTFFEMLGSFSFGDYFKKESIIWGWEFITDVLNMPQDKIWVSVYEEDNEAYEIWEKIIGMPKEKIVKLGKEDNFWEIGTGPCGPCSEIYFDRGEEYGCSKEDCKPGCDCDRYIEFWNHVFTQYDNKGDGTYEDLAKKNIDTGLGLERLACIMQDVDSIFAVDTIKYVLDAVSEKCGISYQNGEAESDVSMRIITDHIRSATFMIGDKITPGNEGRGYVLRRLIRRASRHGRKLGIEGPFLSELAGKVIDTSGGAYPEMEEQRLFIGKIIRIEEEKFSDTLMQGLSIIERLFRFETPEEMSAEKKILPGDIAFKLHDTYGFPYDITEEICMEKGYEVDKEGFDILMKQQKEAGHKDAASEDAGWHKVSLDHLAKGRTVFTGYDNVMDKGIISAIVKDREPVDFLDEGETGFAVLDKTPFYAESGGQASDYGMIFNDMFSAEVIEVIKMQGVYLHKVNVKKGRMKVYTGVDALVSEPLRNCSSRNHTGTHILHKALREVLGEHVQQAGSAVTPKSLRFDFNHYEAMTKEQIEETEKIVNDKINLFLPVTVEEMSVKDAKKSGAVGLFEEKYGDTVRVVSVGDYSSELCGGIHVKNSGQIGAMRIVSETGIASGVRRIEAVTGTYVLKMLKENQTEINAAAVILKTAPELLTEKISALAEENRANKKELEDFRKKAINTVSDKLMEDSKELNGVTLITRSFKNYSIDDLRRISDEVRTKNRNVVLVLAAENEDKATFLVSLTEDLVSKGYHAGKMIKEIAKAAGGGGGGKADMAQAGAKDISKIHEAFTVAETLL